MKEKFENWNPRDTTMDVLYNMVDIVDRYEAKGYILTVRQLYYRFIALDLLPEERRWRRVERTNKWVKNCKIF